MSLHDKIMNIRTDPNAEGTVTVARMLYNNGHRDARHAAAEMANEYDGFVEDVEQMMKVIIQMSYEGSSYELNLAAGWAGEMLDKIKEIKQ